MVEVAAPPCGVLARAMPKHLCVVQNLLDASTDLYGRLRLGHPYGLQSSQHLLGGDLLDRQAAEHRVRIIPQGSNPMLSGAPTPPSGLVACDVGSGAFGKFRCLLSVLLALRGPLVALALERINS